jgi:hypothetical protein
VVEVLVAAVMSSAPFSVPHESTCRQRRWAVTW